MYLVTILTDLDIYYGLTYYSPIFILMMYVISYEKGIISKILSSNRLQKIATFSFEFYMVHELILIMFRKLFVNLQYNWIIKCVIIDISSFIISIVISVLLYKFITNNSNLKLKKECNALDKILVK